MDEMHIKTTARYQNVGLTGRMKHVSVLMLLC